MSEPITQNQAEMRVLELSESLEFRKETIDWVRASMGVLSSRQANRESSSQGTHISAKDVCRALVRDLCRLYKEPPEKSLNDLKIKSSQDIGRIVFGLVDKGLIAASKDDRKEDFADIFVTSDIEAFIRREGIKKNRLNLEFVWRKTMWLFYIAGTIVVIGSWMHVVPGNIGWAGWAMAMLGFFMQFVKLPEMRRF